MPSDDTLAVLADNPAILKWIALLSVVGYGLKLASQMSETVAGMLGSVGKRWRRKGASTTRAARRREDTNIKMRDLEGQLAHLVLRLDKSDRDARAARIREDIKSDYLTYDAEWHATNERHAATTGWEWPEPHHMTFDEYAATRETDPS